MENCCSFCKQIRPAFSLLPSLLWFLLVLFNQLRRSPSFSVMPYTILDIKKIFILLLFLYRGYRYPLYIYIKKNNNSDLIVLHNTSSLKKSEGLNLSLSFLKAQFWSYWQNSYFSSIRRIQERMWAGQKKMINVKVTEHQKYREPL